jgi:hypothetical protein
MSSNGNVNLPNTFDLSELARRDYATVRGFRILIGGIGLAVAVLLVLDEVPWNPWYGGLSTDRSFNLVFFVPIIALCAWFVLAGSPGADLLTIAENGITLRYASGRRVCLPWDDPGFRLTLWRYDGSQDPLGTRNGTDSLITTIPLRNPIGAAVAEAILNEALARGMRIDQTRIGILGPRRTRLRIQAHH